MYGNWLYRRGMACAVVAVAGALVVGPSGVADAATLARDNTNLFIGALQLKVHAPNNWEVLCHLADASDGTPVANAVINLDRDGLLDHTNATGSNGTVTFDVSIDVGTSAEFRCIFPGNNGFVSSESGLAEITN